MNTQQLASGALFDFFYTSRRELTFFWLIILGISLVLEASFSANSSKLPEDEDQ
jgi:hypothetical protein